MQYRVVPFVASVANNQGAVAAANQLEELANELARDGWEYVRLETVETRIEGNKGCFGLGAAPERLSLFKMAVFRK